MQKLALAALAASSVMAGWGCATVRTWEDPAADKVEVLTKGAPRRPFTKLRELDFSLEKRDVLSPSLDDVIPELRRRAHAAGADAVTNIRWRVRGGGDLVIYQVQATAIAYDKPAQGSPGGPASAANAAASPAAQAQGQDEIEVFAAPPPGRALRPVSHLDLYVEKKGSGDPKLEDVLPELRRQARLSGAEAVTDVQWTLQEKSGPAVYHVTATGVVFDAPAK